MASFGSISLGTNPFCGISDEIVLWGGKNCAIKRVIVGGKIYGCGDGPNTGNDILEAISSWQDAVLNGYQSISVGSFSASYARCESLEITNSDYLGAEYRAEFLAYPEEWFSDIVGILEPSDSINASVGQNGIVTVKRTASARAADDRGLDKVIRWLSSLDLESPPDISKFGLESISAEPKSTVQTIDRVNGAVTVEVTFVQNQGSSQNSVLNYTVDAQYDDRAGVYNVTVSGSIEGNTRTNIGTIRGEVESIGPFQLANNVFAKIGNGATLDPVPSALSFSENDETDTVNFSFTYNSSPAGGQKKYFNFTVECDHIKDVVTVNISGTVSFDGKITLKDRNSLIKGIIEGYNFAGLCKEEFDKNSPNTNNPLNINNPTSYSVTINKGADVSADVSVSYSNEDVFPAGNTNYISLDYDIEISPSMNVLIPVQFLDGGGGIFDFQSLKRGSASIKGTLVAKDSGLEDTIRGEMKGLLDGAMSSFGMEDEIELENNVISSDVSDNGIAYEFEIKKGAILNI